MSDKKRPSLSKSSGAPRRILSSSDAGAWQGKSDRISGNSSDSDKQSGSPDGSSAVELPGVLRTSQKSRTRLSGRRVEAADWASLSSVGDDSSTQVSDDDAQSVASTASSRSSGENAGRTSPSLAYLQERVGPLKRSNSLPEAGVDSPPTSPIAKSLSSGPAPGRSPSLRSLGGLSNLFSRRQSSLDLPVTSNEGDVVVPESVASLTVSDGPPSSPTGVSAVIVDTPMVSDYTVYELRVSRHGVVSTAFVRFKRFVLFHQQLEAAYPQVAAQWPLPAKQVFGNLKASFVEGRRRELQQYLNGVLSSEAVAADAALVDFVLDPVLNPSLRSLGPGDRRGSVKRRSKLGTLQDILLVVNGRLLYEFKDDLPSAVPSRLLPLDPFVSIEPVSSGGGGGCGFALRQPHTDGAETVYVCRDEPERNDWVVALRRAKGGLVRTESTDWKSARAPQATSPTVSPMVRRFAATGHSPVASGSIRSLSVAFAEDQPDYEGNFVFDHDRRQVKAATVEKLLWKLLDERYTDVDYIQVFCLTGRGIAPPSQLLDWCIYNFRHPPVRDWAAETDAEQRDRADSGRTRIDVTKLRVVTVLGEWLKVNPEDFTEAPDLANRLFAFIEQELAQSRQFQAFAERLRQLIKRAVMGPTPADAEQSGEPFPAPELPTLFAADAFDLLDLSPLEIARQMTLIDFELFRAIRPSEFLNQKWNNAATQAAAPGITGMIRRFNQVSAFAVSSVVSVEPVKLRATVLARFVDIAEACVGLHNYNAAMGLYSALESSPLQRLRKTWEALPKAQANKFAALSRLLSAEKNFKVYRAELGRCEPPCIPYLGLYLSELVAIEEGNPDRLSNGLVNFEKNYMIGQRIRELRLHQQTPFRLRAVPEIQSWLLNMRTLSESEAYQLSLKCEPRQ